MTGGNRKAPDKFELPAPKMDWTPFSLDDAKTLVLVTRSRGLRPAIEMHQGAPLHATYEKLTEDLNWAA